MDKARLRWGRSIHSSKGTPRNVGEENPRTKLTESNVKCIRALCSGGFTRKEISALYNIPYPTVVSIINRTTWRHIK